MHAVVLRLAHSCGLLWVGHRMAVACVGYIQAEHIGVHDHVEDSVSAVVADDIAVVPDDRGDVEK